MKKSAWLATILLGAAGAVSAQETVKTNAQEIVVTATREWTEAARTPASISVITSEEIERQGANNLSDVLRATPGLNIRSLSGPIAEVSMRGSGENSQGRVLVLLDGHRMNNPDMASMNWLQIPLNMIERVEVLRGSQSALYGDNASAGVVNIITKKGSAEPRADLSLILGGDHTEIARIGVSGSIGTRNPVAGSANAEWQHSDGYRDRSGYRSGGAGGRLGYDFTPSAGMSLAGSWYESDYELPGDLTLAEMKDDPTQSHNPADSADNRYGNAELNVFAEWADALRFDASLGWASKKTENDVASWSMFSDSALNSYSIQPRITLDGAWGKMATRTTLGADVYLDRLAVDRFPDPARAAKTIAADIDKDTVGGYVRHQVELTREWIVNAGGRVEEARLSVDADSAGATVLDERKTHRGRSLEGGLTYAFDAGSKAFARAATVYRYPFVDEQISYYGYGSDFFNRELKAEKGLNTEAGVELGSDPKWRAGVTVYRLDMRDEVAWDPIAYRNANLDKTRRQGVELEGSWSPAARLELGASYTYTDSSFISGPNDGNDVPLVPATMASGTIRVGLPRDLSVDAKVRYVGSCYLGGDVANRGDKLGGYTTLDLMLRLQPAKKPYSAFVGVENVTDETYATVAYKGFDRDGYYPSPGRTWRAGVNRTF